MLQSYVVMPNPPARRTLTGRQESALRKKVRALPASRDYHCVAQRSEPDWNVGLLPNHHGMQE